MLIDHGHVHPMGGVLETGIQRCDWELFADREVKVRRVVDGKPVEVRQVKDRGPNVRERDRFDANRQTADTLKKPHGVSGRQAISAATD